MGVVRLVGCPLAFGVRVRFTDTVNHRTCHLALGSNIGDRTATINAAIETIDAIGDVTVTARSPIIETEALTLPGSAPQRAYRNGAITIETSLDPRALLGSLQAVEQSMGRIRDDNQRWEARTIDIDILLDGNLVIEEPGLSIPHPRMHERLFVLGPLAVIAPDALHPGLKITVSRMLADLDRTKQRGGRVISTAILAAMLIFGCAASPCKAQANEAPATSAMTQTLPAVDPAEAFARIASAYRAAPIADRITLSAVSTYRERSQTAIVRADATTGAALLELGPIHAHARNDELLVIHTERGDRYALFSGDGRSVIDLITESLPPIMFPQLSLVFDNPDNQAHLTPFADSVEWTAAIEDTEEAQLVLLGNAQGAIVSFVVDTESWRLKACVITVPESGLRIEMQIEPIDPGDPSDWRLDTRGMIPVLTLAQLQPGGVDIQPGAPAPPMVFFTINSEPWRLELDQQGPIALLLYRETSPVVLAARNALHAANINHETSLDVQPLLVTERLVGIDLFERIGQSVFDWGGPVLWSVSPAATIERFTSGPACVVLIASDHTVRAIVHLGQGETTEEEARRIDEAIEAITDRD